MKSFSFNLQKILDWRETQLEMAEAAFRKQAEALGAIDRLAANMKASEGRETVAVRAVTPLLGETLGALTGYHRYIQAQKKLLAQRRAECVQRVDAARAAMLEARRRARLLERLKDKRRADWAAAASRELEELASDSYLAQWNRRRA